MIRIKDLKHLAYLLKCKTSVSELEEICEQLAKGTEDLNGLHYSSYLKKKRLPNGRLKLREINPSKGRIKHIQEKLTENILAKVELLDCVHGGRKGRSNVTNAFKHKNSIYKFTTDIKNFYPSINPKLTYNALLIAGFNPDVSAVITRLATFKGRLPQGAPSSTHISNIVFIPIDHRINELATFNNLTYTRYIDDITLSGNSDFKNLIPDFINIINEYGFSISSRKTHFKKQIDITGVKVAKGVFMPDQKFFSRFKSTEEPVQKSAMENYLNYVTNY